MILSAKKVLKPVVLEMYESGMSIMDIKEYLEINSIWCYLTEKQIKKMLKQEVRNDNSKKCCSD